MQRVAASAGLAAAESGRHRWQPRGYQLPQQRLPRLVFVFGRMRGNGLGGTFISNGRLKGSIGPHTRTSPSAAESSRAVLAADSIHSRAAAPSESRSADAHLSERRPRSRGRAAAGPWRRRLALIGPAMARDAPPDQREHVRTAGRGNPRIALHAVPVLACGVAGCS